MSYDIRVFDPSAAPSGESELIAWLTADPPPGPDSPRIREWVSEMQGMFLSYAEAPETLEPGARFAEYSVYGPLAVVSCAFSVAAEVEAAAHRLAVARGLGIWDVSIEGGPIWRPDGETRSHAPRPGLTLKVDEQELYHDPSDALIAAAVQWVATGKGPSFAVVHRSDDDYAQVAGGSEGLTIEWRRPGRGIRRRPFWHGVAATDSDSSGELIDLPARQRSFRVLPNEIMRADEATAIVLAFVASDPQLADRVWHDITGTFTKK
jgi:hypothetical protein